MQDNVEFNAKSRFILRNSLVPNILKGEFLSGTLHSILLVASCDYAERQPCLPINAQRPSRDNPGN